MIKKNKFEIDNTTFSLKNENFYQIETKKTQIILADSLRNDSNLIKHLNIIEDGNSKRWSTYTITREGKIYQHYDPKYYTEFMKNPAIDKKSISIVIENMGLLKYSNNTYKNWINEICDESKVFSKSWRNGLYWETYTNEQYKSLSFLCDKLINNFNINRDCIGNNVTQEKTFDFNGIVCRSNYGFMFNDLNPSFDFKKFLKKLNIPL
jgi:N-acetyl-anhydromuramyl-L-alanine amidase AmpD